MTLNFSGRAACWALQLFLGTGDMERLLIVYVTTARHHQIIDNESEIGEVMGHTLVNSVRQLLLGLVDTINQPEESGQTPTTLDA